MTEETTYKAFRLNVELELTFEQKCNLAKTAKSGDVWINIKTGRKATITGNNFLGVMLQHETGKKSKKQHHYFAYDYNPNDKINRLRNLERCDREMNEHNQVSENDHADAQSWLNVELADSCACGCCKSGETHDSDCIVHSMPNSTWNDCNCTVGCVG